MLIFLTVLLAVGQATSPVPGKAADNPPGTSRPTESQPKTDNQPPAQSQAVVNPPPSESDKKSAEDIRGEDASKAATVGKPPAVSAKRDWVDHLSWFLTLLLVIVGFLGIRVGLRTLKRIEDQVAIMQRQTVAAEIAANAAQANALAASANAKAAEEGAFAAKQGAIAASANAEAAKANAASARENIEIFVNQGRARIGVEPEDLDLSRQLTIVPGPHAVKFKVSLYGPSEAFVIDSGEQVTVTESPSAPLDYATHMPVPNVITPAKNVIKCQAWFFPPQDVRNLVSQKKRFVHFHGFIKYRDVFGKERETRFRYRWEVFDNPGPLGPDAGYWAKAGTPEENTET